MLLLQCKGKTAVENYHHTIPLHGLESDAEVSLLGKGERPSLDGNVIIQGDKLLALKALLATHTGRVRLMSPCPRRSSGRIKELGQ